MHSERLHRVLRQIAEAARQHGRNPETVRLLAVSKQQSPAAIRGVAAEGQKDFGESYAQEALPKMEDLRDLNLTWHFIGRLQGNKTRPVAECFDWVHTVDRARIAVRLNEQRPPHAPPLNVCIQVRLGAEDQKGGVAPAEIAPLAEHIRSLPRLRLRGLMCIPPLSPVHADQLATFSRMAEYAGGLRTAGWDVDTLSMGMSGDFAAAIAAGSTIVRIGTAIFGERTVEKGPGDRG